MIKEQNQLLSLGESIRGGFSSVISNSGKVVAFITLLVAVLVTFTDIAFLDLHSESFTSTLVIMLISAYLMYFSLEDAGEKEGEESEEYRTMVDLQRLDDLESSHDAKNEEVTANA